MEEYKTENGQLYKAVYSRFITRKGVRTYHPKGGVYKFWVKVA